MYNVFLRLKHYVILNTLLQFTYAIRLNKMSVYNEQ